MSTPVNPSNGKVKAAASMMGVWYAVALHAFWAALLLSSSVAGGATALSGPARLFPNPVGLSIILVTVAFCATLGIYHVRIDLTKILLLLPQQLLLGVSAASAIRAMWVAHYADGISRAHEFIIADQLPAVLALLAHSATILLLAHARAHHHDVL